MRCEDSQGRYWLASCQLGGKTPGQGALRLHGNIFHHGARNTEVPWKYNSSYKTSRKGAVRVCGNIFHHVKQPGKEHCTLAGSYSEGATLSQFIILTKKGKTLVKTVDRKGFFIIFFFNLIIF